MNSPALSNPAIAFFAGSFTYLATFSPLYALLFLIKSGTILAILSVFKTPNLLPRANAAAVATAAIANPPITFKAVCFFLGAAAVST